MTTGSVNLLYSIFCRSKKHSTLPCGGEMMCAVFMCAFFAHSIFTVYLHNLNKKLWLNPDNSYQWAPLNNHITSSQIHSPWLGGWSQLWHRVVVSARHATHSDEPHCKWRAGWESTINVWFAFMYSQKWNCAASLFPEQNYNVLSPNSYTHISVRDLFISRIGLSILLQPNMWTSSGNT